MFQRILVSVDPSEDASFSQLLEAASSIARPHGSELHALMVVPTYSMAIVGSFFPEGHEEKALETAHKLLATRLQEHPMGTSVKGHVAQGTVYDEIMKAADKLDCQLIIIGAHRPELKDYLLGPNAARVARHSKQSVFIVRD